VTALGFIVDIWRGLKDGFAALFRLRAG